MFESRDLNIEIMLSLDSKSLRNIYRVNKYFKNICDDQYFWQLRLPNFIKHNLNSLIIWEDSIKYAKMTMEIAKIEQARKDRPTDGCIYIGGGNSLLNNYLAINLGYDYLSLNLNYELYNVNQCDTNFIKTMTKFEAEQFVAYAIYINDSDLADIKVTDINDITYLTTEYRQIDMCDFREYFALRKGIWDTLEYYNLIK